MAEHVRQIAVSWRYAEGDPFSPAGSAARLPADIHAMLKRAAAAFACDVLHHLSRPAVACGADDLGGFATMAALVHDRCPVLESKATSAQRVRELRRLPTPILLSHSRRDHGFWFEAPIWESRAFGKPAQPSPRVVRRGARTQSTRFRPAWRGQGCCKGNYEHRLERPRQRVTLPNHDGPATSLFPRPICTEVRPP